MEQEAALGRGAAGALALRDIDPCADASDAVSGSGHGARPFAQFHMAAECELFRVMPPALRAVPPWVDASHEGASEVGLRPFQDHMEACIDGCRERLPSSFAYAPP